MRRLTAALGALSAALTAALPMSAQAQRTLYGVDWRCGEGTHDYVRMLKRANQTDVSCLAGAGFWEETLPRIGGRMDAERQKLRQLLLMMVEQDEMATAFFETELAAGHDEAALWLLLAKGEAGARETDRRTRLVAVNLFISMPSWIKTTYSSTLADALLAEGDSRAALTLGTALSTIAYTDDEKATAAIIQARVEERFGTVDKAVGLYEEAIELGNDRLSAEAELRKIALMWRAGYLKTEEAVVVLKELVTIWRGESLGAGITLALARAYYFDEQLPQALRLLVGVAGSNAPEDIRLEAERRILSIADDLFVRRLDPATIGDLMDVYELVRPMIGAREEFWLGDLKLAGILVQAGLGARAELLMQFATPEGVEAAGGRDALMEGATLALALDQKDRARRYLSLVPRQSLGENKQASYARLEARSMVVEELNTLLQPNMRQDVLEIVANRAWEEGAYGLYARAYELSRDVEGWKVPTATYLARGTRIAAEKLEGETDVRVRSLTAQPQPSLYDAEDLRPLLTPSAEVAGLAANLTRIGQDLDKPTSSAFTEDAPEDEI